MPPDVLLRKLTYLRQILADLAPFEGATLAEVQDEHYKLERLFELPVLVATDVLFHELAELDLTPDSYRGAFRLAGEQGLLPAELADRLQQAAAMRNVIVHKYRFYLIESTSSFRWLFTLRFSNKDQSLYLIPHFRTAYTVQVIESDGIQNYKCASKEDYHLSIHESGVINFTFLDNKIRLGGPLDRNGYHFS